MSTTEISREYASSKTSLDRSSSYDNEVRREMQSFWTKHSKAASLEEMMLNSDAKSIRSLEEPEVLSLLPDFRDKDVVELACGIGRFTSHLAQSAKSLIAVDFMENFIQKNEEENAHFGNIKFLQADVLAMELEDECVDLIFSNWILMYLSDDEVLSLLRKCLQWLRPGGYLFFRESCFRKSGNHGNDENPTFYRKPSDYCQMLNYVKNERDQNYEQYKFIVSKSLGSYIKLKRNPGQVIWLAQKELAEKQDFHGFGTFQEFLDNSQYSMNGILRYEKIFDPGFVSTGGLTTTQTFVSKLNLQENQIVLDVGCGIGGGNFYMAKKYGVRVHGVDLSANMVSLAMERQMQALQQGDKSAAKVLFEISDIMDANLKKNAFDVIYSRDTILHIKDKERLFLKFFQWTKPGGKLLISDYCCGKEERKEWSEEFTKYVKQRGYHLHTIENYGKLLEKCGFTLVEATDVTGYLVQMCEEEINKIEPQQQEFIEEFSQKDYDDLVVGWREKISRCRQKDQRWALFVAVKP